MANDGLMKDYERMRRFSLFGLFLLSASSKGLDGKGIARSQRYLEQFRSFMGSKDSYDGLEAVVFGHLDAADLGKEDFTPISNDIDSTRVRLPEDSSSYPLILVYNSGKLDSFLEMEKIAKSPVGVTEILISITRKCFGLQTSSRRAEFHHD